MRVASLCVAAVLQLATPPAARAGETAGDPLAGLVWSGKHGEHWGVYRSAEGAIERTTPPDTDYWAWSTDGGHVMALVRGERADGSQGWLAYVVDGDGSNPRQVSDLAVTADSWTCSGAAGRCLIVRRHGDGTAIFDAAAGPAGTPFLGGDGASYSDPEFSPDGTRLLFRSDRGGAWELWIADSDGGNAVALTGDPANDTASPHEYQGEGPARFSPDGQRVAWTRKYPGSGFDVWVMRTDGGDKRNLTADHAGDDSYPAFSPDGTRIAFSSGRDGDDEIYVMLADGSGIVRVTDNTAPDLAPVWVRTN